MKRAEFTLIELLVVVAIIGVLASLLLPALRQARRAAYLAACRSNQSQIYLGIAQYAFDADDHMPAPANGHYPNACRRHDLPINLATLYVGDYLGNSIDVLYCPDHSYTPQWNTPAAVTFFESVRANGYAPPIGNARTTYLMHGPHWYSSCVSSDVTYFPGPDCSVANGSFWHWDDRMLWRQEQWLGTAARFSNNGPGVAYRNSPVVLAHPRALVMCLLPEIYWFDGDLYPVPLLHGQTAFNVLFGDGTVFTKNCADPAFMMPNNHKWNDKFLGAETAHPSFEAPYANYARGHY